MQDVWLTDMNPHKIAPVCFKITFLYSPHALTTTTKSIRIFSLRQEFEKGSTQCQSDALPPCKSINIKTFQGKNNCQELIWTTLNDFIRLPSKALIVVVLDCHHEFMPTFVDYYRSTILYFLASNEVARKAEINLQLYTYANKKKRRNLINHTLFVHKASHSDHSIQGAAVVNYERQALSYPSLCDGYQRINRNVCCTWQGGAFLKS
jgi:hypothetical protein